jgi:hypothetical protein
MAANHKNNLYIGMAIMILTIICWLIFVIPYVLSVTKINNRVLSLVINIIFSLA